MTADVEYIPGPTPARQSQKEATRQRVVNAARELFDTHGYQGTTIREIARHAGVAVGSVFTTFASKGEILSEVMQARIDPLYAELDRVMPHLRGTTVDRLRTMFAIHIEFEAGQVRLFLSHIAAAYDWTLSPGARPYGQNRRLIHAVADCLARGQADGEIRADVDCAEVVDLLMAAYAWTYRLVITSNADAKALIGVMDRQIGLIVEGLTPRS
jgi:AcrR family transcriptional regulator